MHSGPLWPRGIRKAVVQERRGRARGTEPGHTVQSVAKAHSGGRARQRRSSMARGGLRECQRLSHEQNSTCDFKDHASGGMRNEVGQATGWDTSEGYHHN